METLWERSKQGFERILTGGEKAAERVVNSFEELGGVAKARLEKAKLERALFKQLAELGNAVYERAKCSSREPDAPLGLFEEPEIEKRLAEVARLDEDLTKTETLLAKR